MDYRDELRPCQPVHHVSEHLSTMSPGFTRCGRGALRRYTLRLASPSPALRRIAGEGAERSEAGEGTDARIQR